VPTRTGVISGLAHLKNLINPAHTHELSVLKQHRLVTELPDHIIAVRGKHEEVVPDMKPTGGFYALSMNDTSPVPIVSSVRRMSACVEVTVANARRVSMPNK